ncbi:hypothetical protein DFP73DRAFT_525889 [Morchella snyderi]|nr:hypothetical protein DFP73DRAFT_525889 [Morchella snyderi]
MIKSTTSNVPTVSTVHMRPRRITAETMPAEEDSPPTSPDTKIKPKELECPISECTKRFTGERGIRGHLALYKERFQEFAYNSSLDLISISSGVNREELDNKRKKKRKKEKDPPESGKESFEYLSAHYQEWKSRYDVPKKPFKERHREAATKYRVNNKDKVRKMVKLSKFRAKAKRQGLSDEHAETKAQEWIKEWERKQPDRKPASKRESPEDDQDEP